jgi:Tfp pilus assembly protein PilO
MRNNSREKVLIIAALCLFGFFALDYFLIEPLISGWKERSKRIAQLKQSLTLGESLTMRADSIEDRWKEMQSRGLPPDRAETENKLLTSVGQWAQQGNLRITALKPRWLEDEEIGDRLEMRISGSGDLRAVTRFLYELEHDPMAVRLEEIEIQARDAKGTELDVDARVTGLVLPEAKS